MRKRTILAGSILGSLLVAGFVAPAAPAAISNSIQDGQTVGSNECVTLDEEGNQAWFGEADPNVTALGTALQEVLGQHPDKITGVALCSHFEGAAVFLASTNEDVDQAIAGIAAKHPDLKVMTRDVGAPLSTLSTTGMKLLQSPDMKGLLVGAGPNMYTGGLLITIAPDHGPLSDDDQRLIDSAVQSINGSSLPLVYEQGGKAELSTRKVDVPPHYMGSELNFGAGSSCSAGCPS